MHLKKYISSADVILMTNVAYSSRAFSTMFMSLALLLASFFLWTTLYGDQTEVKGYTLTTMYTYYAVTFVVVQLTASSAIGTVFSKGVRAGSFSFKLIKPYNVNLFTAIQYLSGRIMELLVPIILFLFVLTLFPDIITRPINAPLFLISFALGVVLNIYLYLLIGASSFWIISNQAIMMTTARVGDVLSGAIIPLAFFPMWLTALGMFLPFRYTHYVPVSIYLGTFDFKQSLIQITLQVLWIIFLAFIFRIVFRKGVKRYGAVGN